MMKLIVDTNVLVGELLRERGRKLILNSNLRLYATERVIDETKYELERRLNAIANKKKISEREKMSLLELTLTTVETKIVVEALDAYLEAEARERIPADPDDWPTVALAMKLQIAIWTQDNDFLGCGCPTWTTQTLISYLRRYGLM